MLRKKTTYFINPTFCPEIKQSAGLKTTVLTGYNDEKMMMVLNATLPGNTVPVHSHLHEQVGMVYSGKARLRIGDKEKGVPEGRFLSYSRKYSARRYMYGQ